MNNYSPKIPGLSFDNHWTVAMRILVCQSSELPHIANES
ncbi:hypothetical protein BDDG_11636 [Blastomyces dermatitidis ATCC 18188]|uniref:Uncharacterized protein n=1 Tax=Ajellomyces dermatitidis (strain ATCC 18188 / CBS 674.68) TaxID=653446 RepID=A0A0J9EJU1_AJEDA|nr:hypothetical protein BDDG_11636 [Blastomyces dermatitidis ATCC 18188]